MEKSISTPVYTTFDHQTLLLQHQLYLIIYMNNMNTCIFPSYFTSIQIPEKNTYIIHFFSKTFPMYFNYGLIYWSHLSVQHFVRSIKKNTETVPARFPSPLSQSPPWPRHPTTFRDDNVTFFGYFPKQCGNTWGSYGNSKKPGL